MPVLSPLPGPGTPHTQAQAQTPSALFASLLLSPACPGACPSSGVPSLSICPPTPSTGSSFSFSSAPSSDNRPVDRIDETETGAGHRDRRSDPLKVNQETPTHTQEKALSETADTRDREREGQPRTYRPLTGQESRQLTLLLTQHLFPARHSPKDLMQSSISLAEELHEAGIRWDRYRRVMGMHLRGIWEEGGGTGEYVDLYVQGSFVSIAEPPHPLDPTPLPIPLQPGTYTALPKLTLGPAPNLFHSLPFAQHQPLSQPTPNANTRRGGGGQYAHAFELQLHHGLSLDTKSRKAMALGGKGASGHVGGERTQTLRGRWGERKKDVALRIRVDGNSNTHTHTHAKPPPVAMPVSATSARSLTLSLRHQKRHSRFSLASIASPLADLVRGRGRGRGLPDLKIARVNHNPAARLTIRNALTTNKLKNNKLVKRQQGSSGSGSAPRRSGGRGGGGGGTPDVARFIPALMPNLGLPLGLSTSMGLGRGRGGMPHHDHGTPEAGEPTVSGSGSDKGRAQGQAEQAEQAVKSARRVSFAALRE